MFEGILDFLYTLIFTFSKNNINTEQIEKLIESNNRGEICKLIFLLLGILLSSIIANVYKIYCNVIYSPMIKSLSEYILIPFMNFFSFFNKIDFYNSVVYFIICEIIGIFINFLGCVFNEFIILFCFGLEHDTKFGISLRAESFENKPNDLIIDDNQTEENNQENENNANLIN